MNGIFYSLLPHLNRNQKLFEENTQFKLKQLHFEPLDIDCIPKKHIQIKIERKISPQPNTEINSFFLDRLKLQKMFQKKTKQQVSIKCQGDQDVNQQVYNIKLKPETLTLPLTSRDVQKQQIRQMNKKKNNYSLIEETKKQKSKIKLQLPKIKRSSVIVESECSLNRWSNDSSTSLINSFY